VADLSTASPAPVVAVIGGGPAGMSCALWLHNYEFHPVIIERESALGGMARRSPYPNEWLLGRAGESARENAQAFVRHIEALPAETRLDAQPRELRRDHNGQFLLDLTFQHAASGGSAPARIVSAGALVIATGTRFRGDEWVNSVGNARLMMEEGRVHIGAPWAGEAAADLGSHVAIIGGGDNAFDVARMLAEKGARVTIVMRSPLPRARPHLVERLREHEKSGTARVLARRSVKALERFSSRLRLRLNNGNHIEADHVLLLLGYRPNSDEHWMAGLALNRDREGYLVVDDNMETSCPGVFAVGDVANPGHPCIATAIGTGTMAAREIGRRLGTFFT
jgi:thioredoxin reductase (NADPH)